MKRKSSPGHLGGQFELLIAAELLRQGFVVFRSVLAVGPTDLIAIKRGRMLRVQVKSETSHWKQAFKGGNDVLAVVNNGHRSIPRFYTNKRQPWQMLFESIEVLRPSRKVPAKKKNSKHPGKT